MDRPSSVEGLSLCQQHWLLGPLVIYPCMTITLDSFATKEMIETSRLHKAPTPQEHFGFQTYKSALPARTPPSAQEFLLDLLKTFRETERMPDAPPPPCPNKVRVVSCGSAEFSGWTELVSAALAVGPLGSPPVYVHNAG